MLITATPQVIASQQDLSVNFLWALGGTDALEARYVRRVDECFIVYLSSHTGCNQACRFCHLTASKQVSMKPATLGDFLAQADAVFKYYDRLVESGEQVRAQTVHFNWMARGEPLLNDTLVRDYKALFDELRARANQRGLRVKFKISTIFPEAANLGEVVTGVLSQPDVMTYYSLYSLNPLFRRRWIPRAHSPARVFEWLGTLQTIVGRKDQLAFHWAFIEGENDSVADVTNILQYIDHFGLQVKFNLVRYNPYSPAQGEESDEEIFTDRFELIKSSGIVRTEGTRIVPRVGFDVKASCGMFLHAADHDAA